MTATRLRVVTPERLDQLVANLVNTGGTAARTAVSTFAGTATQSAGVSTATANTLIQRDGNARAQVATPLVSADIATKGYVDGLLGGSYVPTSQVGAASGVATLDSTSRLTTAQIPTFLTRSQGSGTSFPGAPNRGDVYYHSGIGCLFQWDGSKWWQSGGCTVASRTARNTLSSTYSAVLPVGFTCTQNNRNLRWRWLGNSWMYAGWEGAPSELYGTPLANPGVSVSFTRTNQSIPHNAITTITGYARNTNTPLPEWLSDNGDGTFTFNDHAVYRLNGWATSDVTAGGRFDLNLYYPGNTAQGPASSISTSQQSGGQAIDYPGAGMAQPNLTWVGYGQSGDTVAMNAYSYKQNGVARPGNFFLSVSILPG